MNNVINVSNMFVSNKNTRNVVNLFTTNTIDNNNNVVRVYKCKNGALSIIKVSNNRLYRWVNGISILIHNIPTNWRIVGVFKDLTEANIEALYSSMFSP